MSVRKDITKMSQAEIQRFVSAFEALKGTTEYAAIAAVHGGGFPADSSIDANIQKLAQLDGTSSDHSWRFAIWHRPYLIAFERLLQLHDPQQAGHSGANALTLPYFDWTHGFQDLPEIFNHDSLASAKARPTPEQTRAGAVSGRVTARRVTPMASQATLMNRLMNNSSYYAMVSSDSGNLNNLESPHGLVHMRVGGDMGTVLSSSWDPIFWMHHCAVERYHHAWQAAEGAFDFLDHVSQEDADTALWPFPPRALMDQGTQIWQYDGARGASTLAEWFDIRSLSYSFDELPSRGDLGGTVLRSGLRLPRGAALRAAPMVERVVRVYGVQRPHEASALHVWVGTKHAPLNASQLAVGDRNYVGLEYFFVVTGVDEANGIACVGCARRGVSVSTIAATGKLLELGYRVGDPQTEVHVRWQAMDRDNAPLVEVSYESARVTLESEPVRRSGDSLSGGADLFRTVRFLLEDGWLSSSGGDSNKAASRLQRDQLRSVVTAAQQHFAGATFDKLVADGVWGEQSRHLMEQPRCGLPNKTDNIQHERSAVIVHLSNATADVKRVRFVVDMPPSAEFTRVADADEVRDAATISSIMAAAGAQWAQDIAAAGGPKLQFVADAPNAPASDCVIRVRFQPLDGSGDVLAWTGDDEHGSVIYFDSWHRWDAEFLRRVGVHELGHSLGLSHSANANSVMFGYESGANPAILPEDVAHIVRALSPTAAPSVADSATSIASGATTTSATSSSSSSSATQKPFAIAAGQNIVLTVKVIRGRNLISKDVNGKSDPYVKFYQNGKKLDQKTKIIKKTLDPEWNESFVFQLDESFDHLDVLVMDWDKLKKNEPMGKVRLNKFNIKRGGFWFPIAPQAKEKVKGDLFLELNF